MTGWRAPSNGGYAGIAPGPPPTGPRTPPKAPASSAGPRRQDPMSKKPSSPPSGVVPPLTRVRTDVWDVKVERYGALGYIVNVHERGGLSCMEYTLTRRGARRWAARHIRAERRARARTPERFTVAPEDLV